MAAFALVHCAAAPAFAQETKALAQTAAAKVEGPFTGTLPANVAEMREAILAAVHSGQIEELREAIQWNELRPDFGEKAGIDGIAHLKSASADGEGREILAALGNLFALAPAKLAIGRDVENSAVYVWPYLAEIPLASLTPAQEVDLYRLMPPQAAKLMREKKKWTWWRLAIGADGTWHTFRKFEE